MPLTVILNGQHRTFAELAESVRLDEVIARIDLKPDRVAVEHNGEIAPRATWSTIEVHSDDRLEIVHFVGGGAKRITPLKSKPPAADPTGKSGLDSPKRY